MSPSRSRSYLAALSLALGLVGLAAAGPAAYAESQDDIARDLVASQKPLYQLGGGQSGEVDAWVDNPDLVYRVGQQLKVYIRPKHTSYITVLNAGSSGRVSVLFPNYFQRDAKVRAGQTVVIPAETSGWQINVAGPPGVEIIKIIATPERLDLAELNRLAESSADAPILSLDRSAEVVARDLVPQLKGPGSGGGLGVGGVKHLLVRVLPPRGAGLQAPFAGQKLGGAFGLTVRPERPIYKIGDSVRVAVAVREDCQLSLVGVGTSGRAVQLFPNKHQSYGVIRAGQTLVVPSPEAPFEFKAEGPAGVEGLMATCRSVTASTSTVQGTADFPAIDGLKGVTRDLIAVPAANEEPVEHVSSSFIVWN